MNLKKLLTIIVIGIAIFSVVGLSLRSIYVVPILMYHNIDGDSKESKTSVSPKSFEAQMKFLNDNRYNVIALDELIALMKNKSFIPPRTVSITFDDGYENNYTNAYPVLKKYNLSATIFIIANYIGKPGYLKGGQITEMLKDKIAIGSHSLTHPFLQFVESDEILNREIEASKRILESRLNCKADVFCYPQGGFNENVKQKVIEAGYVGAVATNMPSGWKNNDIYALPRLKVTKNCDNIFVFWFVTSGYYTFVKDIKKHLKHFRKGLKQEKASER